MARTSNEPTWAGNLLMGGCAAVVAKTAAAPIERIKLMIQNQDKYLSPRSGRRRSRAGLCAYRIVYSTFARELLKTGRLDKPYAGIYDAGRRAVLEDGPRGLWRGNGANCMREFPTQALNFFFKARYKALLDFRKSEGYWSWVFGNVVSGGLAGSSTSVFVYSLDYARTRLSADSKSAKNHGQRQYAGLIDVYTQTLKSDGIAGLYRGFVPSVVGIFVYRGLFFGCYDTLKETLLVGPLEGSFLASFLLGWAVTSSASLAAYPLDTVRRRMMMTVGEKSKYKGFVDAGVKITKAEGWRSLYKGAGVNILRGVAGAGILSLYDKFQDLAFGKVYPAKAM